MATKHKLEGLEPDNLLAVLALLGLMRALDRSRSEWRARAWWEGMPLRPWLLVGAEADENDIAQAAAEGCAELAEVHFFEGRKGIDWEQEAARGLLESECKQASPEDRRRIDLLSALMSDGAAEEGKVRPTPYCALFGQGHQHFLERMAAVPRGELPKELAKEKSPPDLNSPAKLAEALFRPWERKDPTQSFRWDPREDRRYALRFENPSGDKGLTVHGANRLASLALALLPSVPMREGGKMRLMAAGTSWKRGMGQQVKWPVWSRPARLSAIAAMVAGSGKCGDGLGVIRVYVSDRITVNKNINFTRAVPESGTEEK